MNSEKLVIKNGILVTMDKDFKVIENGSVVVADKKIIAVGQAHEINKKYKGDRIIDAHGKAILPGLINTHYHSHVFTRGMEGSFGDINKWLIENYYAILKKMSRSDVRAEAELAYVESIKTGTTCVNDMYAKVPALAAAAENTGIRACLSTEAADLADCETLKDNERAFLEKHDSADGRIKIWFGVEWVPVCSSEFMAKARELANKYKTGIHIHLSESSWEVKDCEKKHGKRPVEYAQDHGILNTDCVAAHCVWLTDKEIETLRKTGTHVAHCPIANMKVGNGVARAEDMVKAGINLSLGTDAVHNSMDMFEVMKYASYLQKAVRLDISALPYDTVLKAATIGGAKALGMQHEIGSIEVGKKADIILIDVHNTRFEPVRFGKDFNLIPNLVYAAHGENVSKVIIDGEIVMENQKMKTVDEEKVISNARTAMSHVY